MSDVTVSVKILIPNKAFPKYNFVGKLLGPGGTTMKKLQAESQCKMAVMGRGCMKDKKKEDDLRKEGGKYAHLNEPLHVFIEAVSPAAQAHLRMCNAIKAITPILIPEEQMQGPGGEMGGMRNFENGGDPERAHRGGGMGGPPAPMDRPPYREDPYYQEPAPPAPVSRGYDDYRGRDPYERASARPDYDRVPSLAGGRDPYERVQTARGEYERMPPASADMRAPAGRGGVARSGGGVPPMGRAPGGRESYYDYQQSTPAPQRERYTDPYESRVGVAAGASSGGNWGATQGSYKGAGAPVRSRGGERAHPYQAAGRGGAPRY